ncbi:MAG: hypothetical protein QOH61_413, partial [Chloroflexota bacterium]|nr:hypothetical protein [Chloroflexota bacterium]
MVHGAAGEQLFLVVAGLTVVSSPFVVLALQRSSRNAPLGASVALLRWLVAPIVACSVASAVLQLLVLEERVASSPALGLAGGVAALIQLGWALVAGRRSRFGEGPGPRFAGAGLAINAAAAVLGSPASAAFALAAAAGTAAWLSPVRRALERRRLSLADAQLGT